MTTNYIDNKQLYDLVMDYTNKYKAAVACGGELPRMSNRLGRSIEMIANNLSMAGNFKGYSFRSDMVGDAVENTIRYLHNFNPEKSKNPFAYITQIIYYAFLRRIEKENKQAYIKFKLMSNISQDYIESFSAEDEDFAATFQNIDHEKLVVMSEKFAKYETKNKTKGKKRSVETLAEDSNE